MGGIGALALIRVLHFTGLLWLLVCNSSLGGWQLTERPFDFKETKSPCCLLAPPFWTGKKALPSVSLGVVLLSNVCAVTANLRRGVEIAYH